MWFGAALCSLLLLVLQRKEECFVRRPRDELDTARTSPADLLSQALGAEEALDS